MKQDNPKPPRRTSAKDVKSGSSSKRVKASAATHPKASAAEKPALPKPRVVRAKAVAKPKRASRAAKPKAAKSAHLAQHEFAGFSPAVVPVSAPVAAVAPVVKSKAPPKDVKAVSALNVPPFLMEGDHSSVLPSAGPAQRYALGPTPPMSHVPPVEGELPEAFGTEELFLTARDPHWLYAAWDMTSEQLRHYNALSVDRHLVLRVYRDVFSDKPLVEIHVNRESRNWFAPVPFAGAKYLAEVGFYAQPGQWVSVSRSAATMTPPDTLAEDAPVRFSCFEPDMPLPQLVEVVKKAARKNVPLVEALEQLRAEGFVHLPAPAQAVSGEWTPVQVKALEQVISVDMARRVWVGSLEVTELVRRQLESQTSSLSLAGAGAASGAAGWVGATSLSSPYGGGGVERQKGFWFNVNAELIIYGATEASAKVTIGGRLIQLRPDGSFGFRFALPDGEYSLPAVAVNADGDDGRSASLHFSRATEYKGGVDLHPQDPGLKPPTPDAVS
jgi:hypothetical protein